MPGFIEHYRSRYGGEIPIWVAIEGVNFSLLSKFYSVFKEDHQKEISRMFKLKKVYLLESWLRSMTELRNKCAHGSRIYAASLSSSIKLSQDAQNLNLDPLKVFSLIFTAKYLVQNRSFWNDWVKDLETKTTKFEQDINWKTIGFVPNWKYHLLSAPKDTW
ncbi:Abi family protein [Saccharibacillus sp. CPCC 101409]|nr:Abi family protein [Saccharibacillus sp. CPCC 101409]MDO3411527.1 Abi family protein [Saccharibacillus sp. CPCC 101409]